MMARQEVVREGSVGLEKGSGFFLHFHAILPLGPTP